MAEIIVFRSNEMPKLNYPEIEILLGALGKEQGLRVFERVMFEISDKLCQLEMAIYEEDLKTAERCARSLRTLSPQVGLQDLAHIANDMIEAILQNNSNALPAICHRMVCLGEASLFQLAELPRMLADQ
jgi:hypothetical protein